MCNIITKQHCWLLWMCCSLSLSVRLCACACTLSLFDSLPLYFFPPRSVTTSLSFFHATFLFHPCPGVLGSALLGRFLYSMFPCPVLSLLLSLSLSLALSHQMLNPIVEELLADRSSLLQGRTTNMWLRGVGSEAGLFSSGLHLAVIQFCSLSLSFSRSLAFSFSYTFPPLAFLVHAFWIAISMKKPVCGSRTVGRRRVDAQASD